jgi:hypothetical protein
LKEKPILIIKKSIYHKDKLVYKVEVEIVPVFVISAIGHYSDK